MSLGFEVDFLAVIGLVNQLRKSFTGAPEQFKAISDDVRGFSIVLQDIEASCTELGPEQKQEYQSVVASCKLLLEQLEKTLEEYASVAEAGKTGKKAAIKRVWKRLKWEPDDIREIRNQISFKIATLKSLNDQVTSHNIVRLVRHQEDTEREATIKWVSDINYVAQQNDTVLRCQIGSRRWLFESELYLEWCKQKGSLLFCPGNPGTGKTFTTAMVVESLRLANDAETLTTYMYCTYQNHTQTIEKLLCSLLRVALEEADCEADGTFSTCKQLRSSNKTISRQHCLNLLQDIFSRFARVNLIVDAVDEITNEVRRPLIYDLLKLHEHTNVSLFVTSRGIPEIQHLFEGCEAYTSLEVRSSDEDIRNFLRGNVFKLPNFVARSQKLQDEVIDSVTNASAGMFLLAELYLKSLANMISVRSLRTRLSNLAIGSNAYDALYEDSMLRIGLQGPELEHIAIQMLLVLTCARRPLSPQELSHALSIDEISDAFDEDMIPDMDDLVAACTGLVVLDDTSNVVHLVHRSTAEYFERTRSRWFPRANEKMAFICLRYLQIAEAKLEETGGEHAPFFHYAKANWCYHSVESEKEAANDTATGDASQTNLAIESGTSSNQLAVTQLAIQQMTKEVVNVESSIIEACHAGHQAWVEQLLVVRNYDMNMHGVSQDDLESKFGNPTNDPFFHKPFGEEYSLEETSEDDRSSNETIEDGHSLNETFRDDILLTIATARGDCSMARMLLARGADPNIFNAQGQTSLFIATTNGFDDLVSLLLDQKSIKPDLICQYAGVFSTAFLASIKLGRLECFKMLLERSDRRVRDNHERGAMWLAAVCGYSSMISELLKWPDVEIDYTNTDICGNSLTAAIRGGHEEAALLLVPHSNCQSCSYCGITPIHYAVRKGFHDLLKQLLEHDASEVDSELYISTYRNIEDRGWHLQNYCDWRDRHTSTKTPLMTAIHLQDIRATQLLLPYADVNQGLIWRPLHEAADVNSVEIFGLLLEKENIEPDPIGQYGRTPFLMAAERGNCDIMKMLVKKGGVQFDRRDTYGNGADGNIIIPYFYNPDYFRILASALDIDVNEKNSSGSNLLHRACRLHLKASSESGSKRTDRWYMLRGEYLENNSAPLVAELLKRPGVDVNILDKDGKTPLLLAVENYQRDVVRLILERENTDVVLLERENTDEVIQDEKDNDAPVLTSKSEPMFEPGQATLMNDNLPPSEDQVSAKIDYWQEVLNAAFKEYDESIFRMLISDKRTNLHCKNHQGEDILARVAMTGTKSMVQAVLETTELASDPEILCRDGQNLLSLALQNNQDDEAVDLLIAHCTAVVLQKADGDGRSPLSYAVQRVTSKATRSLLEAGVDINVVDRCGKTALSFAVLNRDSNAARLLIDSNEIKINIPDHEGLTPLMYASDAFNIPVISALLIRLDVDVRAIDGEKHSFLCYLMESYYSVYEIKDDLKKELDGLDHCIRPLLPFHGCIIDAYDHSPFICALESAGSTSKVCDKDFRFIQSVQRYGSLVTYFHPGLILSQCRHISWLLDVLGENNEDDLDHYSDDRSLGLRVLQLFENKGAYNRRI